MMERGNLKLAFGADDLLLVWQLVTTLCVFFLILLKYYLLERERERER